MLCAGTAVDSVISEWFYGADMLSFNVQVSAWFLFSIFWFVGCASFGRCHSFGFLFLSLLFFLCVCVGSIGCEHGCHALVLDSLQAYSFLPFRLDLFGLGVGVPSQSLELSC